MCAKSKYFFCISGGIEPSWILGKNLYQYQDMIKF